MDVSFRTPDAVRPEVLGLIIREEILYVVRSCGRIGLSSLIVLLWSEFPDASSAVIADALLGLRSSGLVVLEGGSWSRCAPCASPETTIRYRQPEELH